MSSRKDPLFRIFEQHLFNAMVEDETTADFVGRVVTEYIKSLAAIGSVPHGHRDTLEIDLREEVFEMLRKKTYGHFSLNEFRKNKVAPVQTDDDATATKQSVSIHNATSEASRPRKPSSSARQRRSS